MGKKGKGKMVRVWRKTYLKIKELARVKRRSIAQLLDDIIDAEYHAYELDKEEE